MRITVIIVNFNAGDLLGECVAALLASQEQPRIIVVDNASSDGSAARLKARHAHSPRVELVCNPTNLGFGAAVNAALPRVQSDYVLVLNPDCLVAADSLTLLGAALEKDPEAGLAGPLVLNPAGRPEKATLRRFPTPWKSFCSLTGLARLEPWLPGLGGVAVDPETAGGRVTRAEAVSGACLLLRCTAINQIGGFDEEYALHCEDLDLMYRLRAEGWHCLFVPAAVVTHHQGVSSRSRPLWVHRQKHRGMSRFFRKFQAEHYSLPVRWLVTAGIWIRFVVLLPRVLLAR